MPADPRQRVAHLRLLRRDLRLVGEILEAAAAAGRVVRARRLDALRRRLEHLGRERLGVAALHLRHARAHACRPEARGGRRRRSRSGARRRCRRRRASRPGARAPRRIFTGAAIAAGYGRQVMSRRDRRGSVRREHERRCVAQRDRGAGRRGEILPRLRRSRRARSRAGTARRPDRRWPTRGSSDEEPDEYADQRADLAAHDRADADTECTPDRGRPRGARARRAADRARTTGLESP